MKVKILDNLDEEIKKAETEVSNVDIATSSYKHGIWTGLLRAREIIQKTPEEGVKHG